MTLVRASCPDCGDVELTTAELTLRVCADTDAGSYIFRCPSCLTMVAKPAEPRTVTLLAAYGTPLVTWRLPAELNESHRGRPITHDDALDFHALLESDEWIQQALTYLSTEEQAS